MISWRLTYPGSLTDWRPLDGIKGIKRAKSGADYLIVTRDEKDLFGIPLEGKRPIFCELRAIENGPEARPGGVFHVAYVFGRGTPETYELWTLQGDRGVSCSPNLYEEARNGVLNCMGLLGG